MTWECGECLRGEGRADAPLETVCHHCGKLLCPQHNWAIDDEAFVSLSPHAALDEPIASGSALSGVAHCEDCCRGHHPKQWKLAQRKRRS